MTGNMIMNNLNIHSSIESKESLTNTNSLNNLFKAPRGSNQSILRGKGPKNYTHLTVEEMVNERLGIKFDNHCDNYPVPLTVQ